MTDEPIPRAPEPNDQPPTSEPSANRPIEPQPAEPKPAERKMVAPRPAPVKSAASKGDPPKAAKTKAPQTKSAPVQRKAIEPKPAKAPKAQAKAASEPPKTQQPKPAPAQRKAVEPKPAQAPRLQAKAASSAPKPEQPKPAAVQRKAVEPKPANAAEPESKPATRVTGPKAAKPESEVKQPAPVLQRKKEPALEAPRAEAPKPASPKVEPEPAESARRSAAAAAPTGPAPTTLSASDPASSETKPTDPAAVQRAAEPLARSTGALDAMGRRLASRLARTESALSPWTQQTLQLQRPAPPAEPEPSEAQTGQSEAARAPRPSASLGSLARRVQRQEQQGASGTFGRLAGGVERAERFAGRIAAHFPVTAAKYEAPAAPEGSTPAPAAAPSGPNFTYYPEGASTSAGKSSQSTLTAAEMFKQLGLESGGSPTGGTPTGSAPVQRAPAPERPAAKPAAPPPQAQAPRDPRRIRRFSKIEEVPPPGEERPTAPPAPAVQHKPEPTRPSAPPLAAAPARPEAKAQTAPAVPPDAKEQTPPAGRRRRPRFEEVSTPSRAEAPVQRNPEPETTSAPPASATSDDAGPLRWDHLGDLPPSIQRQLERVQQRLAEQSGLQPPPNDLPAPVDADAERPFHPRNINPPPPQLAESLPSRLPSPESEAPISFGPDLQPRPSTLQRQPLSAAARPTPEPRPAPATAQTPEAKPAPMQPRTEFELPEPEPLSNQALPLFTPPATEPSETEFGLAFAPPAEPAAMDRAAQQPAPAEPQMPVVQREIDTPRAEPQPPIERPVEPLTLRQSPAPTQPASAPIVQRQPAEPRPELRPTPPSEARATPASIDASLMPVTSQRHEATAPASADRATTQPEHQPAKPTKKVSEQPATDLQRKVADATAPGTTPVSSQAQQPLTLRQPTSPDAIGGSEARDQPQESGIAESAVSLPPEPLPSVVEATAPTTQRSPLLDKPAEEPLVLRQPTPPPTATAEQPLPERPVVQRAELTATPAPIPAIPTPTSTESDPATTRPPVIASKPGSFEAASPAPVADIQREPIEPAQQPLILREAASEPPAVDLSEPVQPPAEAPSQPGMAPARAAIQRQVTAADDLPLRTPPVIRDEAAAGVETTASAPELSASARLQRQPDHAVPQQSTPPFPSEAGPRPTVNDLPLRAAPVTGGEARANIETTTGAPELPQNPRIQRDVDQAIAPQALPLRVPPEIGQAPQAAENRGIQETPDVRDSTRGEQPRASQPSMAAPNRATPPATLQRQADAPASRGPALAMPLHIAPQIGR